MNLLSDISIRHFTRIHKNLIYQIGVYHRGLSDENDKLPITCLETYVENYTFLANELAKLFCSRGANKKGEILFSEIAGNEYKLHPPTPALSNAVEAMGGETIFMRPYTFKFGGSVRVVEFITLKYEKINVEEWLNTPIAIGCGSLGLSQFQKRYDDIIEKNKLNKNANKAIKLESLIKSIADKQGAHCERKENNTITTFAGIEICDIIFHISVYIEYEMSQVIINNITNLKQSCESHIKSDLMLAKTFLYKALLFFESYNESPFKERIFVPPRLIDTRKELRLFEEEFFKKYPELDAVR